MISRHEFGHHVTITGQYPRTAITVDGHELQSVTRAHLILDAETLPVLKLSLLVLKDMTTDLPCRVLLDKPTTQALTAMGWTPPPDTMTAEED